jgi:hypothetical protein
LSIAAAAGAGWLVADLALDRADVAGGEAAALLAVAGCAVVVTLSLLPGRGAGRRDRRVLIGAASVNAALAPIAAAIESPTDTEPALTPSALAVGALRARDPVPGRVGPGAYALDGLTPNPQ